MANLLVFSLLAIPVNAISQTPDVHQIVTQLVGNNQRRAALLRHYEGCRLYVLDYTGFPSSKTAEMVVDMKYDAPDTRYFFGGVDGVGGAGGGGSGAGSR